MLRFVKLINGYYLDEAVADGTDAAEVMYARGKSYCGLARSKGRIPRSILPSLCRRPSKALAIAEALVDAGLWTRDGTAYLDANWDVEQEALDAIEDKRTQDRERKRKQRAEAKRRTEKESRGLSQDPSRDVTQMSQTQGKREEVDAAAAAPDADAAADTLPGPVEILRSKLQQFTALRAIRFDTLKADQLAELGNLLDLHGDARLVQIAVDTCRTPPPTFVTAFLGTWRALPAPGKRLQSVHQQPPPAPKEPASPEAIAAARATFEGRKSS